MLLPQCEAGRFCCLLGSLVKDASHGYRKPGTLESGEKAETESPRCPFKVI